MSGIELDKNKIPNHIAFILDGNGRWAKYKGKPRTFGHNEGAKNIGKIVKECNELGVKCVTVYAFSTENWKRPQAEVDYLMSAPVKEFKKNKKRLMESDVRIKIIGRRNKFNKELLSVIEEVEEMTKDNSGILLQIAADYGSRLEMVEAFKKVASKVKDGSINVDDIDEEMITNNLYTSDAPELDLLVRTSGEQRISNFLLWQLSYSELYFTNTHWPAFNKEELYKAIFSFQNRNRRYGGLKEE